MPVLEGKVACPPFFKIILTIAVGALLVLFVEKYYG
ncbi:hypothetical protein SHAQ108633_16210 [Shewanella aquimarina]